MMMGFFMIRRTIMKQFVRNTLSASRTHTMVDMYRRDCSFRPNHYAIDPYLKSIYQGKLDSRLRQHNYQPPWR